MKKMPVLFVGHGSPTNAIENNEYTNAWEQIAKELPRPEAILCISAHWYSKGTKVTAMEKPKTIHDFYDFPKELYEIEYPANGSPKLAERIQNIVSKTKIQLDTDWGLDHGTWSVLCKMFPKADIPVIQLSIDSTKNAQWHYDLAKELMPLRNENILIVASGNIVHNLGVFRWEDNAYDWATIFDNHVKQCIIKGDHLSLIEYEKFGKPASLSVPTNDHYLPMLYILALINNEDKITFFSEKVTMGSISMRSFIAK